MSTVQKRSLASAMLLIALSIGCSQNSTGGHPVTAAIGGEDDHDHCQDQHCQGHCHRNWWCDEHGVPEDVCGQCNAKLAADFQKKGDWCQEHDRPDSQCFICHPEREARFAAQYEAKFGKLPPQPEG